MLVLTFPSMVAVSMLLVGIHSIVRNFLDSIYVSSSTVNISEKKKIAHNHGSYHGHWFQNCAVGFISFQVPSIKKLIGIASLYMIDYFFSSLLPGKGVDLAETGRP